MATLYDTLEVASHASPEVIRAAYKVLISRYHPDRQPDPKATEKCAEINKAYDTLSNSDKKKQYDQTLRSQGTSYSQPPYGQQQYGPAQKPTYKSYTPPPPPPPPDPKPQPVYKHDPKWEKFLSDRPDWAKLMPPQHSWGDDSVPVRQVPGGFVDVRPDLDMWGDWIIRAGNLANINISLVESEIVRTWGYFSQGFITMSLIREAARTKCDKSRGYSNSKVNFGM
jgi:hypothetical protein